MAANSSGQQQNYQQNQNRQQRTFNSSTSKSFNPHHRSSEVFSTGLLPPRVPSAIDYHQSGGSTSSDGISSVGSLDITSVRPRTIEEAIRQMQQVPNVDFACSGISSARNYQSNSNYHQAQYFTYHNHPLEAEEESTFYQNSSNSTANDRTFQPHSSSNFYHHNQHNQQQPPTIVNNHHDYNQHLQTSSSFIITPPSYLNSSSMPFSTDQPQPSTSSRCLEPPSATNLSSFHRKYSVNNSATILPNDKPSSSLAVHSLSYGQLQQQQQMNRSTTGHNAFFRSNLSSSCGLLNNAANTNTNTSTNPITSHQNNRRLTVARLGSDYSGTSAIFPDSEASSYFVPRESWLTSLYVKMPKSKSFFRLQLELLNLPFFASVNRFLEDTCSVGSSRTSRHHSGDCRTAEEEKTLLEKNSFLFALFNQYVPHNRIPLESLSKYVRRLQKYEILATIEFSVSVHELFLFFRF